MSSSLMDDETGIVDCGHWVKSLSARSAGAIARHPNTRLLYLLLPDSYKLTAGSPGSCAVSYCWLSLNFLLFDRDLF